MALQEEPGHSRAQGRNQGGGRGPGGRGVASAEGAGQEGAQDPAVGRVPAAPRRAGRREGCGSPALAGCWDHQPTILCFPGRVPPRPCWQMPTPAEAHPAASACPALCPGPGPGWMCSRLSSKNGGTPAAIPQCRGHTSSLPLNRVDLRDFFNPKGVLEMVLLRGGRRRPYGFLLTLSSGRLSRQPRRGLGRKPRAHREPPCGYFGP